jgi:hypothetical protein
MRIVTLLAVALVVAAGAAAATAPKPDGHDRVIVRRIDAQSNALATLASKTKSEEPALQKCSFMKKDPVQAFAAAIAVLPAILIQVVDEYRPEFVKLRDLLDSLHPDSALFTQWLGAERQSVRLLLRFDNGGKQIDLCKAGEVMLSKTSTAADVQEVLGIDPALIAKLFDNSKAGPETTLTRLKPKMRTFFVAAGLSAKRADAILN